MTDSPPFSNNATLYSYLRGMKTVLDDILPHFEEDNEAKKPQTTNQMIEKPNEGIRSQEEIGSKGGTGVTKGNS